MSVHEPQTCGCANVVTIRLAAQDVPVLSQSGASSVAIRTTHHWCAANQLQPSEAQIGGVVGLVGGPLLILSFVLIMFGAYENGRDPRP